MRCGESKDAGELGMKPGCSKPAAFPCQPKTENPRDDHGWVDNDAKQTLLHDLEGL